MFIPLFIHRYQKSIIDLKAIDDEKFICKYFFFSSESLLFHFLVRIGFFYFRLGNIITKKN
jgi:hypothetical protein